MEERHPSTLDMESVFFRLYTRLVHFVNYWTSPASRFLVETLAIINAFALLFMLIWFHIKYVTRAETNCVTEVLRRELEGKITSFHMIRLQVSGIWSHLEKEDAKSTAKLTKLISNNNNGGGSDSQQHTTTVAQNLFKIWLQDPVYVYSPERGYLMLDEHTRSFFNMTEKSITFQTEQECFSESFIGECERYLLDNFIGYDTVILNAFGAVSEGKGYLYSIHSRELLNVAQVNYGSRSSLAFKFGAIATTLFLFFITTTLVHHTLRETQERMLKFTFDLQVYVRRGIGYGNLVLNHVVGSLVFVPIMVGMLFFLFEFFNDQLLAFMVLAVVWVCELFSVIALRTYQNVRVFPRLFFLYFCSFHLYFFLFPSGFSYMALTCCVVFLQHAMVSFFIRYEMDALLTGKINISRQREVSSSEFIPEEIQAAGASLAVRALAGATGGGSLEEHHHVSSTVTATATTNNNVTTGLNLEETTVTPTTIGRKKRPTIHTEPEQSSPLHHQHEKITTLSPPTGRTIPPPISVGPTWLDEDDSNSQTSGWEIGGAS